jgi:hypothetical protein
VILPYLPGPTSLIPPAAHLAWLAALTGLAVTAAAWRVSPRRGLSRLTGLTALATAGCLGVAGWSGWTQTRPVPRNVQASLIYQATHPAAAERCTSENGVRYCAYPGFRPDVTRWATAVNGVLARLPSRAARPLVVRQVVETYLYTPPMTVGFEPTTPSEFSQLFRLAQPLGRFLNAQRSDPHLVPGSSVPPVYVDMNWGAGAAVGVYQLSLAMQTAWWVAGLPTSGRTVQYPEDGDTTQDMISCLPVGQAREAIAVWLATSATPAGLAAFRAGLTLGYQPIARVRSSWVSGVIGVPTLAYSGYMPALQFTRQGSMLAQAMLRLPEREVLAVLAARWPGWLSPRATDAQLAAALRITLPAAVPPPASQLSPGQPADPVCR